MDFVIMVTLVAVIIFQRHLYKRVTSHLNNMTMLMMMLLLDKKTYDFQRKNMEEKIPDVEARDENELYGTALINYQEFANQIGHENTLDVRTLLWKMKTGG